MDPLRDYKPGERLSVRTVNELTRRAKRQVQFNSPMVSSAPTGTTVAFMRNSSGEDVARFGVLGIDGSVFTYDNNPDQFFAQIVLEGTTATAPSSSDEGHSGKFAIAIEPIADGDIGRVVVAGLVHCQLNVDDESHNFADPDGTTETLTTADSGSARILYKEEDVSSGNWWALVLLGPAPGACVDVLTAIEITCNEDGTITVTPTTTSVRACPPSGS